MPFEISKEKKDRLKEVGEAAGFRAFVTVPPGTAEVQMINFKSLSLKTTNDCLARDVFSNTLYTRFRRTKACDKMEVCANWERRGYADSFMRSLEAQLGDGDNSYAIMSQFKQRLLLMSGLALSSVLTDATFLAYDQFQSTPNRFYKVAGADVRLLIQTDVSFTGDATVDFKTALYYLWFHFPYDVTHGDNGIKKASLMTL